MMDNSQKFLGFLFLSVQVRITLMMIHQHMYVQEDIVAKFLLFKVKDTKSRYLELNFRKRKQLILMEKMFSTMQKNKVSIYTPLAT